MRSTAVLPAKAGIPHRRPRSIVAGLAALAAALPAAAQDGVVTAGALETLGSLVLVLGTIFALAWLARRLQGARLARGALLQVQGGVQLGGKERVVLLQAGGTQFLIGVSAGSVNLLHRFDTPLAGDAPATPGGGLPSAFAERLRQALGGRSA